MNIDVSKIVQDKIDSLDAEGVIEKAIVETFEKTVINAITESLDSYDLTRTIKEKMTQQVSKVVADLDFESYNSFMIEKMSQIINKTCREDICEKAEQQFKDIFLCPLKEVKLSSIFKKYREIACEKVDEQEKYNRCDTGWHCKFEPVGYPYNWIKCELDYEDKSYDYKSDSRIAFTVHRDSQDKTRGSISTVYLDGKDITDKFKFGYLNDVELILVRAVLNQTPIIIDVEDESDIDNSFDIDW